MEASFWSRLWTCRQTEYWMMIQTGPGAHPASCTMGTGSFPGVKAAGAWRWQPSPSSPEVMKEWTYTSTPPLGPCGQLQGETLPYLTLPYQRKYRNKNKIKRVKTVTKTELNYGHAIRNNSVSYVIVTKMRAHNTVRTALSFKCC